MLNIAIVDDDCKASKNLIDLLSRYQKEEKTQFAVCSFSDSEEFLRTFNCQYDLLFLDVQIPKISGMDVARQVREKDKNVAIIFETDFAKYAVQGYKYNALDYFLKPVSYYDLKLRMSLLSVQEKTIVPYVVVFVQGGSKSVLVNEIYYVEQLGHDQIYHTATGDLKSVRRQSLASLEKEYSSYGFARCSSSFLVNLSFCTGLIKGEVMIHNLYLKISRGMRKNFITKLSAYYTIEK
ncbi:MAG: LytTR family DNA-binding domain-containing protein [Bacilli bacterium]